MELSQQQSIQTLLSNTASRSILQRLDLSETTIVDFHRLITALPCTRIADAAKVLGTEGGGPMLGNRERFDKIYPYDYRQVALSLVVALWRSKRKIVALYDTPQGAVIEGRLPFDLWSIPQRLAFAVVDEGGSFTSLIGTSLLKGSMRDWGKGRRALEQILRDVDQLLDKLTPAQ